MGHARARKVPAQLVEDEDYQLRYERVAGIDVAKAKADVCTRLPRLREGGRRASRVETVGATAGRSWRWEGRLIADGVEVVVMESTSDYWRIWLRREAPCCIPGSTGRNLEDIPGSDGLLKSKGEGDNSMPGNRRPCQCVWGRRAGQTRVIWLKLNCLNSNLQKG